MLKSKLTLFWRDGGGNVVETQFLVRTQWVVEAYITY